METMENMDAFWKYVEKMTEGIIFAMLTDEIIFEKWPLAPREKEDFREKEHKLLDVRVFNEKKEIRMFRGDIGRKLQGRVQDDEKEAADTIDFFDEEQYLDIDSVRSKELFRIKGKVAATGGGCYRLPLEGYADAKIKIRNYLEYYKPTGQAYIKDWRLVRLFQEGR